MPFTRFDGNPIISPNPNLPWQSKAAYNPAAIFDFDKVHLLYRAQAQDGTSVLGYATSHDGIHIEENLDYPIYVPREEFEKKTKDGWNSGCEDPRITRIGDTYYLTYTAYDGTNPPRVALSTISVNDFMNRNWNWSVPQLLSPPGIDDKDACIISHNNRFYVFHRFGSALWLDEFDSLSFIGQKYISGHIIADKRPELWDNVKIGLGAPPLWTDRGWVLLYHGVSQPGFKYEMGALLLDHNNLSNVIGRTSNPLLVPEAFCELNGQVPNAVFGSGAVLIDGIIYMYYGAADTVIGVATIPLADLFNELS